MDVIYHLFMLMFSALQDDTVATRSCFQLVVVVVIAMLVVIMVIITITIAVIKMIVLVVVVVMITIIITIINNDSNYKNKKGYTIIANPRVNTKQIFSMCEKIYNLKFQKPLYICTLLITVKRRVYHTTIKQAPRHEYKSATASNIFIGVLSNLSKRADASIIILLLLKIVTRPNST